MPHRPRTLIIALAVTVQLVAAHPHASADTNFWSAGYMRDITNSFEFGDAFENVPRSFQLAHRFMAQSPGWPTDIAVTTGEPTSELTAFPMVTPTIGPDGRATYTWNGSSFLSTTLRDERLFMTTPGFRATRTLTGGRHIPAMSTVSRQFQVRMEIAEPVAWLSATIVFQPSFSPPGSPPLPVKASSVDCPGGSPHPFNPALVNWFFLTGPVGTVIDLFCTVELTNTADADATYVPAVELHAFDDLFALGGGASFQRDVDEITFAFTTYPPSGTEAFGHLSGLATRRVTFVSENRAPRRTVLTLLTEGTFAYGFQPALEARLSSSTGAPLAGEFVTFELSNVAQVAGGTFRTHAFTRGDGVARATLPFPLLPGAYPIEARFDGRFDLGGSSDEGMLTIVNSVGRVTGGVTTPNGGSAGFVASSDGTKLEVEVQFSSQAARYHATNLLAFGISVDGRHAEMLVEAADGQRARLRVSDQGEPGGVDSFSFRTGGAEHNPGGAIDGGNIQIR